MTCHQQITLDTVTPETEYKNLKSKELNAVYKYNNCSLRMKSLRRTL